MKKYLLMLIFGLAQIRLFASDFSVALNRHPAMSVGKYELKLPEMNKGSLRALMEYRDAVSYV